MAKQTSILNRYGWIRRVRLTVASLLAYVTKHPMFIVGMPAKQTPPDGEPSRLRLTETPAYWIWIAIGFIVVSMPLAIERPAAIALVAVAAIWLTVLALRVQHLNRTMSKMQTKEGWHLCSPYWEAKSRAKAWIPCAGAALVFSLIPAVGLYLVADERGDRSLGCGALYALGAVICAIVAVLLRWPARAGPTLPALDSWRAQSPTAVQAMIDASMHGTCRYPSIAWRTYPDMRSEVIRAGLALALFPASPDKPIWRRSPLYVLTYFAPVSLPLLALIVTPLTWPMAFGGTGLDNTTKVLLALSSMVWAAWAIAFFSYFGERDFLVPWRVRQKERFANATTELLGFPNRHARNLAAEFFADKGPTAFNLMALVVVPAFAGYIGLFSAPDKPSEPAAPVVNETHISLSSTQCEISPSAVANVSLSASGTANISLKGKFSRRTKAVGCETGTAASAPSLQTSEPPHSASSTASAPFEVDTTAPSVR